MADDTKDEVTWASMPHKDQIAILCLLRVIEPLVRISIVAYIYYQLQALDESLPSSEIVKQAAWLQTCYTVSQSFASVFWGRVADSPRGGRKLVLVISLTVSSISCFFFGLISSYWQAVILRVLEGATSANGPMVRTMVSEVVQDKRYVQRAFALLPMSFNMATLLAPVIASQVSELSHRLPDSHFLQQYPYAPPAFLLSGLLLITLLVVIFLLEETLEPLRGRRDPGIAAFRALRSRFSTTKFEYKPLPSSAHEPDPHEPYQMTDVSQSGTERGVSLSAHSDAEARRKKPRPRLPLRRIFTRNLVLILVAYTIGEAHTSAWNAVAPSFLSEPTAADDGSRALPFRFGGGVGMRPSMVALYFASLGAIALPIQFGIYPRVAKALGTLTLWRMALYLLPVMYMLAPYLAVIPSTTPSPGPKTGLAVWSYILLLQTLLASISAFVTPTQLLLVNSASPHPTALGTTHSIAFFVSGLARAASAAIGGTIYAYGSSHNMTGLMYWVLAGMAALVCWISLFVKEGNGHEIWLTGDEEE